MYASRSLMDKQDDLDYSKDRDSFVIQSESESRTLGIIQEFRLLYEEKMKIIENADGKGDCNLQAKLSLQNDWIRDLNEQNEMLVRAVEELEQEATERVMALEEKLRQSGKCACELKEDLNEKQSQIKMLESKLAESVNKECQKCSSLRQSMLDMRDALTAEVADKHDAILSLKRDVQVLEEQCRKADQQTHFKDDIIKELRKEIKQLKQEMEDSYKIQIKELESENEELKEAVKNATNNLELLAGKAEKYFNEKSYLEEGHSQDLKRIHELEKQTQTQQQSITCISENSTKTIQALQEELQTLRANYEDKCQIIASFQEEKSSKLNKDCPGDKSSSDESCVGNFAPLAHSSGKKFKAEEEKLQEVVHEFHNSVSRMIVTECQSKQDKDRITDLELQLSEIWKQKEIEVVAARSCREEEIRNLKRIIDTLMANLESEKRRSESLQKGNQCRDLKVQLESALTDKDEQEGFVEDLNEHLTDCQKELAELFNILSEEQTEKQIQCDQIASLKEELQKLNEKLNVTLDEVTKEKDRNSKLSASLMRSKCLCSTMKKEIVAAHKKLENAAQKMSQDAREIKSYKFELEEQQKLLYSLREESINYKERLEDKENQCLQIQKQVANVQQEFQLEVNHYQLTIDELRSKVDQMECNCRDLGKELSKTRIQITEYEDQNSNLKQIIVEKETKYITQCNKYQCEQERLIALVNQLEFRVTKLHNELQEKNELLMDLKKELCNGEELRQEGVVELKNEINVMIQTQNALKTENERLQLQLSQLRTKLSHNEEKTKNLMSELEQCLIDLQNVQSDKDFLLQKNDQLVAQLQALQDLCHTKTESMVNLEMELNDSKNLRDTLCNESRHVIEHVRSWLQEQRKINLELNERIKHKNETISKLNVEKRSLQQKLKQMYINSACSRQTDSRNSSCDVNSPYGGTFQQYPVQIIQSPGVMMSSSSRTNNCWSLGSVESPVCSLNDDSDFENDQMYEEPPHVWIHRVESLTEELQRSNQYWKDRMSEQDREFSVTKDK